MPQPNEPAKIEINGVTATLPPNYAVTFYPAVTQRGWVVTVEGITDDDSFIYDPPPSATRIKECIACAINQCVKELSEHEAPHAQEPNT